MTILRTLGAISAGFIVAVTVGCSGGETTGVYTILDDGSGPQLCDEVMESYPPQCHGTPIVGWDWGQLPYEEEQGVRWGMYSLSVVPEGDKVRVEFLAMPSAE